MHFARFVLRALAVAGLLYLLKTPEFESQAVADLVINKEQVSDRIKGRIPAIGSIVKDLQEQYDVNNQLKRLQRLPRVEDVRLIGSLLLMVVRGSSQEESRNYLQQILDRLEQDLVVRIEEVRKLEEQFVLESGARISKMVDQLDHTHSLEDADALKNPLVSALLTLERYKTFEQVGELRNVLLNNQSQLIALRSQLVRLVRKPILTRDGRQVTPRPLHYLLGGLLVGVFLGACVVYGLHGLQSLRQRLAERASCV